MNMILDTDSYKFTHHLQNPPGVTKKWSYIEARGGEFSETMFFGLQMWLMNLHPITQLDIEEAMDLVGKHLGPYFNEEWNEILADYGGRLPLQIEALPEGTMLPPGNCQLQVTNTDPRFPWLPAYIETSLLRAVWYPSTVATISRAAKKIISSTIDATSDHPEQIPFKLHDFGARGVSSRESAGIGGVAHLVNFKGTDTVEGLLYAQKYYAEGMAGFSIPAAEHSTVTSWGPSREKEFVSHMVETFASPGRLVAVVGDSYSIYNFTNNILGDEFKAQIAKTGGTLVERPDSGDPVQVPLDVISLLMKTHGHSTNSKGYRILPDYIRVIQGDGMCLDTIKMICARLISEKIAIDNIAFGMGGALLQKLDRDTLKYAMKTNAMEQNGKIIDVCKRPVTDSGKNSKAGILSVCGGKTIRSDQMAPGVADELRPVFKNGKILHYDTLEAIRKRAWPLQTT